MRKLLAKRRCVEPADVAYACADLGDKEQTFILAGQGAGG